MARWLARSALLGSALTLVGPRSSSAQAVMTLVCDSAQLRTPASTAIDTIWVRMKPSSVVPVVPRPWADLLLDEIGSRFRTPRPLQVEVYDEAQPAPAEPAAGPMEAEPSLYAEVRLTLRRDGRVERSELMTRSMTDAMDAALLAAIRQADSAAALPPLSPLPPDAPDSAVVFIALTRGRLPLALRSLRTEPSRAVAVLALPRFDTAESVQPMPGAGPVYPADDRKGGRPGTVLAQFVVDQTGAVVAGTTNLISYTSPSFASSVLAFLPTARYRPATISGCAVPLLVQQPFEFRLFPGAR